MKKAVLFDMDGTLVDNTAAHIRAFEIFCARYNVTDWQQRLSHAYGMGNDDIMRRIMPEAVIREKGLAALAEEKEAIYREIYAPEIHPVAGLVDLLEQLHKAGIRCAVGSSGCKANVDFVLMSCNLEPWFDARISGDLSQGRRRTRGETRRLRGLRGCQGRHRGGAASRSRTHRGPGDNPAPGGTGARNSGRYGH